MNLSSVIFVFGFFPIFLLIYYVAKEKYRSYIILAGSVYFYYVTEVYRVRYILVLCVAVYLLTWGMERLKEKHPRMRTVLAGTGIVAVVCVLFYYRYLDYIVLKIGTLLGIQNIWQSHNFGVLLGLSFLTFSVISYIADCYTGKVQFQRNPFKLATYIIMFPKIIMGPIERYSNIENELNHTTLKIEDVSDGLKRFVIGFCKKVIIADNLAILVSQIQNGGDYPQLPVLLLWLGSISFSLQLFYDFSGYSDMAIGIAQMLGFHFKENFNYPYCAVSVTDFWRRWHISLSFWFRDYVYIPLGGSRGSTLRNVINLFVVWLLTGLWHGATVNFVLWGGVYFIVLLFERYILKLKSRGNAIRIIWRVVTLLIINFNWVIFNNSSYISGLTYCKAMFGVYGNALVNQDFYRDIREYGIYLVIAILFSVPIAPWVSEKIRKYDKYGIIEIVSPFVLLFVMIWAVSFIMLGAHNPFLYQQF